MNAIFVTLNVKSEFLQAFTEASFADGRGSVREEPGCYRFDVLQDSNLPTRFYLYEVYRDDDAMNAHLETPHFKAWLDTVEDMLDGPMEILPMKTAFPSDEGWQKQKPGLVNW